MSHGWNGADPTEQTDPASYELGTEFLVGSQAITITAIRVWAGPSGSGTVSSRMGRLWTTGGSQLGSAALPNTLPAGWSQYNLASPVVVQANMRVVVSYTTGGMYGALVHGLDSDVVSADGAVTAESGAHGTHGDGSFTTSVGSFPTNASNNNSFYGVDIVYNIGSGNQPPTITGMSVTAVGALATGVINATDPDTLLGATYFFDWGDGTVTSGSSNTQTHTYTASGDYAVLGTVTDAFGLSAYKAAPIAILLPGNGFNAADIQSRLTSIALSSGLFASVSGHEPASPAPAGLSAALFLAAIGPSKKFSGLSATAGAVTWTLRIYDPMTTGNLDDIDPRVASATSTIIGMFSADFTLGGAVFVVDLLGMNGVPLAGKAGYINQTGQPSVRIMDITIPLVIDAVWAQGAGV